MVKSWQNIIGPLFKVGKTEFLENHKKIFHNNQRKGLMLQFVLKFKKVWN